MCSFRRFSMYDVELVVHDPGGPQVRCAAASVAEVLGLLRPLVAAERATVLIGHSAAGVSVGDFYLWLCGPRAQLRADAHRAWYATEPAPEARAEGAAVEFLDDDGSPFAVPWAATVSRDDAMAALVHWLSNGDLTSALHWE